MGAYVHLLEYGNLEGMIMLSELSRRRIRSINRLIRVGRQECVLVMRVDKEKGYIDLSKRRVSPEDIAKCEEKYNKSKTVHSIIRHISETTKNPMLDLYELIAWPLYKKYGHAFDAFKAALYEPDAVLEGIKMDDDVKKELLKNIERRMTPQPLKMRADIELTCFHYEGIDAIKKALGAGEAAVPDEDDGDEPIKINLVAPPLYVITMTSLEKKRGIEKMTTAIEAIETVIAEYDGSLNVKVAPRSVTERDDKELNVLMEELERANMEVSGDDDVSDDEDGDK
eukprot:TRINITY_DN7590_c0_g2_i1.p1 TRINITY_DN7590_c0_g2~~TRINITY_DN7590_c0_g2_i1.p1  ORF type:complete len:320 (+),score=135.64 TRINITY_DN7590_c0_g2_i1:114-962(+)